MGGLRRLDEVLQDRFNRVCAHLEHQARPALQGENLPTDMRTADGVACRYRTYADDGELLTCAVGSFIPPHLYNQRMEGVGVVGIVDEEKKFGVHEIITGYPFPYAHSDRPTENVLGLLTKLQRVHDNPGSWIHQYKPLGLSARGKQSLDMIADSYKLKRYEFKQVDLSTSLSMAVSSDL